MITNNQVFALAIQAATDLGVELNAMRHFNDGPESEYFFRSSDRWLKISDEVFFATVSVDAVRSLLKCEFKNAFIDKNSHMVTR